MKITDEISDTNRNHHAKLTLFVVSKDQGGHWLVHEECIVRTAVCRKAHVDLGTKRPNKIKPIALAIMLV